MHVHIVLTTDNTDQKADVGANLMVTIPLCSCWSELQQYNRFFISTHLSIPIIQTGLIKAINITLRNHFNISDVNLSDPLITVTQSGYVEGTITDVSSVQADVSIWGYDLIQ